MAEVSTDGVGKRFGSVAALDGVSVVVPDGRFAAILGPSGCGKTTLLRIVAGLETPGAGRVTIGGVDVTAWPPERRRIGMMFQSYALFPHMTVAENVRFPLRMRRRGTLPAQRAEVARALELVRLGGFEQRFIRQLSGGQQQRVALARAIVGEPRVLLLDEPLSNLDAQLRRDMQVELIELQRKIGLTTIFVTHDQEEALSLADLVVLMNAGRVEQVGTPREIYDRPASAFTAAFIGAANLVPVEVRRGGEGWTAAIAPDLVVPVDAPADAGAPAHYLALRQEDLRLAPAEGVLDCEVSLPAKLIATVYQGAQSRFVVEIGGRRISAIGDKTLRFEAGAAVRVGWRRRDARLL